MGPVSGLLWLAGAAVAVAGWFLPDAPHDHPRLFWGLVALTVAYSVACVTRLIPWQRVSIGGHALAVVALQPLVAAALWLTGGADAYMGPNERAFGHVGAGGATGLCDPDLHMGFSYGMNLMHPSRDNGPRARRLLDALYASL